MTSKNENLTLLHRDDAHVYFLEQVAKEEGPEGAAPPRDCLPVLFVRLPASCLLERARLDMS